MKKYDSSSIKVLEGLDAVRKRPGMYIGSTDIKGMHHLLWEMIDNAVDEIVNSKGNEIHVILKEDNSIVVEDNGRGIPVDTYKNTNKSALEILFTKLHSGAKFDDSAYKTSGGLHGVGASVTNALSSLLDITVYKGGKEYEMSFHNGGKVKRKLKVIRTTKKTGTKILFMPDRDIFPKIIWKHDIISDRLREKAFLNNDILITLSNEKTGKFQKFQYEKGLESFVSYLFKNKRIFTEVIYGQRKSLFNIVINFAMCYVESFSDILVSFANNVRTVEGGSHEIGFNNALLRIVSEHTESFKLIKKTQKLELRDVKEGLVCVLAVSVPEKIIEYEGQTKNKLGTPQAKIDVETTTYEFLKNYFSKHKNTIQYICEKSVAAQKVRIATKETKQNLRQLKDINKRNIPALLGKLTKAQSKNHHLNELFLVEGDSAGGSAKLGRDRKHQAILPLRGKVINSFKSSAIETLKNNEILSIISAVGSGIYPNFNIKNLNYGKIIIMTDADTDGAHIQVLLLSFFYKYMPELFTQEKIFVAKPPLFNVKFYGKNSNKNEYFWDDYSLKTSLNKLTERYSIQRYKGLGEMNPDQLWDTTMDPEKRQLIKVNINDRDVVERRINTLMSSNVADRKEWINENVLFTGGN